jgi:hypothetical protein
MVRGGGGAELNSSEGLDNQLALNIQLHSKVVGRIIFRHTQGMVALLRVVLKAII